VSTNGGSPTNPRTVGARHAVLLPFAYPRVGVHERPGPSRRGMVRRQDAGARTQPGRAWDPPLPGPAPFAIRDSPFAVFHHPPLAARCSLLAVFLHSNRLSAPSQASRIRSRLSPAQGVVAGSKRERLRALDKHAVLPVQSASII
jgi:hypothetical protein